MGGTSYEGNRESMTSSLITRAADSITWAFIPRCRAFGQRTDIRVIRYNHSVTSEQFPKKTVNKRAHLSDAGMRVQELLVHKGTEAFAVGLPGEEVMHVLH
jgi:hypothetical protein